MGVNGLRNRVNSCIELAKYTEQRLQEIGINAWRNTNALTVVLDTPNIWICKKYHLAVENDITHIICMPGITKAQIDEFIEDIKIDLNKKTIKSDSNEVYEEFLAAHF